MNCEEMKIAILKREHGLLDESVQHDLDAHLGTCSNCASMALLGEGLVALKHAPPRTVPSSEDLVKHHRTRALRAKAYVTALIAAFPVLHWGLGASPLVVLVTAGLSVAGILTVWIIVRRRQARIHQLASSRHFLASLRLHLEEDLRASQRAPLGGVIMLAMGGAMSAVGNTTGVFLLLAGVLISGVGLFLRARAVPQLRAELAELDEQR